MSISLPGKGPRVVLFGMDGPFSATILAALLEKQIEVCALILPTSPIAGRQGPAIKRQTLSSSGHRSLPIISTLFGPPSLQQLAQTHAIPVWEVSQLKHPETVETLASLQADLFCVACFSLRIPQAILDLPGLGALNVHPSLLPQNRGPVPLFWTFREDAPTTGVTIHALTEALDSGAIFAQEELAVPDGISYAELEQHCVQAGGALLAQTAWGLYQGHATALPQDEAHSSYRSFPTDSDFVIQAEHWSARHAYNFIQGVGIWGGPVHIYAGDYRFPVTKAFSYSRDSGDDRVVVRYKGELISIRCQDGWLHLRGASIP